MPFLSHTATLLTLYRRGKNCRREHHKASFYGVDQGLPMTILNNAHFCVFLHIFTLPLAYVSPLYITFYLLDNTI